MNKMHTTAKIAAGILGVYLLIQLTLNLIKSMSIAFTGRLPGNTSYLVVIAVSLLVMLVFGGAVFYFLIYRSDIFANKVVGQGEDLPEPSRPAAWYPFALRLAVMIAGFLFLQRAIPLSSSLVHYIRYSFPPGAQGGMWQVYEYAVYFLIYLAISIYLLSGAPHFVRWQVKRRRNCAGSFPKRGTTFDICMIYFSQLVTSQREPVCPRIRNPFGLTRFSSSIAGLLVTRQYTVRSDLRIWASLWISSGKELWNRSTFSVSV
jgi:hypothetical protein